MRAERGSRAVGAGLQRRVELRLARAAAYVAMAGLAALPFAGGLASSADLVATGPVPTSTTIAPPVAAPAPRTPAPPPTTPPPPPPAPARVVEAPPIAVPDRTAGMGAPDPELADLPLSEPADATQPSGPGPSAPSEGVAPAPEPPPPAPEPRTPGEMAVVTPRPERVWVVSIGIDDYPGDQYDLRAADDDAATVTDTMANLGVPADHIYELLNGAATADAVVAAADWLVAHAGPEDTAVFFYAGHVRDLGSGTEVLVGSDGSWVADWFLASRFAGLQSADAWFAIAACFAGGFTELLAPGRILTGAAPAGELAYESSAYGRSFMVEYLFARAIAQRLATAPTVQAAVAWANAHLAADHPEHTLWHEDDAGHVVSLDGGDRRDRPPGAAEPPPPPPPAAPPPEDCVLRLFCG